MILTRISEDESRVIIARAVAARSTCRRRRVGCVLFDEYGIDIGTGRNGTPKDTPHCIDTPCAGANFPSGEGLDKCDAVHAEINALMHCPDINRIRTAVCTTAPCINCVRALLNTACKEILFIEDYPHVESKDKWERAGRLWRQYTGPDFIIKF